MSIQSNQVYSNSVDKYTDQYEKITLPLKAFPSGAVLPVSIELALQRDGFVVHGAVVNDAQIAIPVGTTLVVTGVGTIPLKYRPPTILDPVVTPIMFYSGGNFGRVMCRLVVQFDGNFIITPIDSSYPTNLAPPELFPILPLAIFGPTETNFSYNRY